MSYFLHRYRHLNFFFVFIYFLLNCERHFFYILYDMVQMKSSVSFINYCENRYIIGARKGFC